jgi:hypothetical protein
VNKKCLNALEIMAIALAALLIIGPLSMASMISYQACHGGNSPSCNSGSQPWHEVFVGTRATDWLALLILAFQLLFFIRQTAIGDSQTDLIDKQATISHQNYLQTHRPRLRVRNIVVRGSMFTKGNPIRGQFYVDNIGGTNAKVVESHCEFL